MKKNLIIICLLCSVINGTAQNNLSTKDSISTFYNSIVSVMKSNYLYRDKVNWAQTESALQERLLKYENFKNSLEEITFLFDNVGADHCSVYLGENIYTPTYSGPNRNDFSPEWLSKFKTKPKFEVKIIDEEYGYILIPSISFEDISSRNIHRISQPLYDQISKVKQSKNLKGWIIDLRFNSGGNSMPMLLALYDFLGDNPVYGMMNIDKKLVTTIKLKKGKYYDNHSKSSYIKPVGTKMTETKVAIITGLVTASSGEVVALAFKGRGNTIFIGENTMGMTTTNTKMALAFGAYMAITIGYDSDRNGIFYECITPDIEINKQDNFENLSADKNIQEAINFISK
ncbi:S41 family peptidase [Gillisia sp. JM1]|uniref:S41 family peptidase n=1 Tax=Gillisia sp. JM1 TaxID=1283286 RepID=UPI00041BB427|nr:S41 family peptidase [Gillisia sp. JM1]